jgi:Flp pilus assembly protein CpaB
VEAGATLRREDLHWIWFPAAFVTDDALDATASAVGRVASERLLANEPLRADRLAATPAGEALPKVEWPKPPASPSTPPPKPVMAIVAAKPLSAGARIADADLYALEIQPSWLPDGVFLSPEHVVGRTVCQRVLANEIVRAERLDSEGACPKP